MDDREAASKIEEIDPEKAQVGLAAASSTPPSTSPLIWFIARPTNSGRGNSRFMQLQSPSLAQKSASSLPASSTPPSPSPFLGSMARPTNTGSGNSRFIQLQSPRLGQSSDLEMGMMSPRNPVRSVPISPNTSPSLPSGSGSSASYYPGSRSTGPRDFTEEEQQMIIHFFPFTVGNGSSAESRSRSHRRSFSESDLHGASTEEQQRIDFFQFIAGNGSASAESRFHRRSFSEGDACYGSLIIVQQQTNLQQDINNWSAFDDIIMWEDGNVLFAEEDGDYILAEDIFYDERLMSFGYEFQLRTTWLLLLARAERLNLEVDRIPAICLFSNED